MHIEFWPVTRPIPYASNARKISQEAIDKVAGSIKEFGWQQAIVCDGDDVIIIGHTRLLAAQKLGLEEVPVKVEANLSKAQVKALRLADNRTHQESKWEYEMLAVELAALKDEHGFDLLLTGFDQHEIDPLLAADWSPEQPKDDEPENDDKGPEMFLIKVTPDQHVIIGQAIMAVRHSEADPKMSEGRCVELICADYLAGCGPALDEEPEDEEAA